MNITLLTLLHTLQHAADPAEVFGATALRTQDDLKRRYRSLAGVVHPDHNLSQQQQAAEAFHLLQRWYAVAQQSRMQRSGMPSQPVEIISARQRYTLTGLLHSEGDLCDLHPADASGMPVLLKIVRNVRNNDLLECEALTLARIDKSLAGRPLRAHFPTLVEHFVLFDEAGLHRHTNVLRNEQEFVTLEAVLRSYPGGVAVADAAWMFNRVVAALAIAHDLGIVHGAITPAHILLRLADHNGMLVDWCYSVEIGRTIKAVSLAYAADAAPEIHARLPATPATDLFMVARCIVRLMGGSGDAETLPASVPPSVRRLLAACLIPSPKRRIGSAWQLFDDFQDLLQRLYGQRTFRPFHMQGEYGSGRNSDDQ